MKEDALEDVDKWLLGHKTVVGFFGKWGDEHFGVFQSRCGIADIHGNESGDLCLSASRKGIHQSIACIYRGNMIYHLDLVPDTEEKENFHTAHRYGLPPFVKGNHWHLWKDNRDYIEANGFNNRMPLRRPMAERPADLRVAIHMAADDLNIQIDAGQRAFEMPEFKLV
jgi:hypothetical protein